MDKAEERARETGWALKQVELAAKDMKTWPKWLSELTKFPVPRGFNDGW